jgi:hypothetical protein
MSKFIHKNSSFITDTEIDNYLNENSITLISHGGVGSEYITRLLKIKYPFIIVKKNPYNNIGYHTFENAFVHFPYPPITHKIKKCIYLYGDIYNSLLSQMKRHPQNSAKLCNDMTYPHISNIQQLSDMSSMDPFNIYKQIYNFMNNDVTYPIILIKYGFSIKLIPILAQLINKNFYNYIFRNRLSTFDNISDDKKNKIMFKYSYVNDIVKNSPDLIIRFPAGTYNLSQQDVLKYVVNDNFPGNRIKHYKKIDKYEIYNERDCNSKYGRLRIRNRNESNEFKYLEFTTFGINNKDMFGGVEDPRCFSFNNQTYIIMNGLDNQRNRNMYLYNLDSHIFCKLYISNYDISHIKEQKNWIPYIHSNQLFFIYSLHELCVLKVEDILTGKCKCIKGNPLNYNNQYKYAGSTQLIQWNYPNYIGFVHTRNPYYTCPIIYNVETMNIKHIGKEIIFKNPKPNLRWRGRIVQFPYDLEIINEHIILSVEFEDKCPTQVYLDYISFCKSFSR